MSSYKDKHSIEERKSEASRIRIKYPERIPVIVEKGKNCTLNDINKQKYLVPENITLGQFIYIIRKKTNMNANDGLYIFINNRVLGTVSSLMAEIYNNHKDDDEFLYITYHNENTFG